MPSSRKCADFILDNLPPYCNGTIYELGSGWGGLAMKMARKFPESQIVAYEISPIPFIFSKVRKAFFLKNGNLKIYRKDFFNISISNADCVVFYLYSKRMKRIQDKIYNECKPKTLVISSIFSLPEKKPIKIVTIPDLWNSKIYLYLLKG